MHRIDTSTRVADLHGPGKGGFEDQDAPNGVAGTHVSADWLNDLQENVCEAVEADGTTLVKGDAYQLLRAIRRMIADSAALEVRALGVDTVAPANQQINDLLELGGVLYGVGQDAVVAVSTDGIEWVDAIAGTETAHYVRMVEHPAVPGVIGMVSSAGVYFVAAHPTSMAAPFLRTSGDYSGICAAADVVLAVSESAEAIYRIPSGASGPGVGSGQYVAPPANPRGGGTRPTKSVAYDAAAGVAVIVGPGGYVLRSVDEGVTWTAVDPGADIDFDDVRCSGGVFVARASATLYRSTDLGLTWTSVAGVAAQALAEAPGGRFHAGSYFSADSGATWRPVDDAWRLDLPGVTYASQPCCYAWAGERWLILSMIIGPSEIGQQLASGTTRAIGGIE